MNYEFGTYWCSIKQWTIIPQLNLAIKLVPLRNRREYCQSFPLNLYLYFFNFLVISNLSKICSPKIQRH